MYTGPKVQNKIEKHMIKDKDQNWDCVYGYKTDSECKVEYMFTTCSIKYMFSSELIGKTFIIFFFPFLFQQKIIIEPWILIPRENREQFSLFSFQQKWKAIHPNWCTNEKTYTNK